MKPTLIKLGLTSLPEREEFIKHTMLINYHRHNYQWLSAAQKTAAIGAGATLAFAANMGTLGLLEICNLLDPAEDYDLKSSSVNLAVLGICGIGALFTGYAVSTGIGASTISLMGGLGAYRAGKYLNYNLQSGDSIDSRTASLKQLNIELERHFPNFNPNQVPFSIKPLLHALKERKIDSLKNTITAYLQPHATIPQLLSNRDTTLPQRLYSELLQSKIAISTFIQQSLSYAKLNARFREPEQRCAISQQPLSADDQVVLLINDRGGIIICQLNKIIETITNANHPFTANLSSRFPLLINAAEVI